MNAKRPKDVGILQHHARLLAPLGVFPVSPLFSRLASYLVLFRLLRFCCVFFSSSSLRAIDEYQFFLCFIYFIIYRTPFVFFFLVFLYLLDSVPSLTSFSFPSSYKCFFLLRLASTLYSMISPVVSVLSSLVVLYSYRFPEHFFFFFSLSPSLFLFL